MDETLLEKKEVIKDFIRNILEMHEMITDSLSIDIKIKDKHANIDKDSSLIANRIIEYAFEMKAEGVPDKDIPDRVIDMIEPHLNDQGKRTDFSQSMMMGM